MCIIFEFATVSFLPSLNYTRYVASLITDDPESCTRETITSLAQNRKEWGKFVAGAVAF
jgi:hypothetical protein